MVKPRIQKGVQRIAVCVFLRRNCFFICSSLPHSALMLAQRKRICGKVTEQNLNWGLQNWLSTLQRSPFFRHHFSKSTLNSALFPRLLCVGRMRVDMTMYGEGQAVRVATPSRSSTTSWASSSDKHAILKLLVNTNATTASSDNREVPPDVIFGLYELTLRLWKNGANSAVKCIRRLRLWACTHVEYGWVASVDPLQVSLGRRRCIRIRIRFVSISVAEPKVNV